MTDKPKKKAGKKTDPPSDLQLRKQMQASDAEKSSVQKRQALRRMVRLFYDIQRLRLQAAGRLGPQPEGKEIELHEDDKKVIERRVESLLRQEKDLLLDVQAYLKTIPFYRDVLSDKEMYRGIGPTLAGVLLAEMDIERQEMPSQMHSFAGLGLVRATRCGGCDSNVTPFPKGEGYQHPKDTSCALGKGLLDEKKTQTAWLCQGCEEPLELLDDAPYKAHPEGDCDYNDNGLVDDVHVREVVVCIKCSAELVALEGAFKHPRVSCEFNVGGAVAKKHVSEGHKAPRPVRGQKLPYNAFLKTKLLGVMGGNLIKAGSPFRKFYDDYKHRKANERKPDGTIGWGSSDMHRHRAAIRYMVKMVLLDIWIRWRQYEGLSVRASYHEEKQGGHGYDPKSGPSYPFDACRGYTPPKTIPAEAEAEA